MLGPRDMDPNSHISSSLQHRASAKQLIGRYESLSSPLRKSRFVYAYSGEPLAVPAQRASSVSQRKEKSPIRQSFRNLFSVFKKATGGGKGETHDDLPTAPPALSIFKNPSSSRPTPRAFSGSLLYLSRPPDSSGAPVSPHWITCTATLEDDRITIASTTLQSSPALHTIYLSQCSDVRSLTVQQLDTSENILLQQRKNIDELRVFEILFEGRAREKFAATSVRERAGWVSAIWDAILPSQEPNGTDHGASGSSEDTKEAHERPKKSPLVEGTAISYRPPFGSPNLSQSYVERLLPPIPSDSQVDGRQPKPSLVTLQDQPRGFSPVSPSIYPPTRPPSRASSKEANPRSTSPSLMNLGRLSVVQQRLAQIERNTSQQSCSSGLTSPTPSSRGSRSIHLSTPELRPGKVTNPHDALESKRMESVRSSSIRSILDSYGDTGPGLPKTPTTEELVQAPHSGEFTGSQQASPHSTDGGITSRLEPFAELLRDHTAKNYDQTANLGDQIISLQDKVQRLSQELASVILDGSSRTDIHKIITSLEAKAGANGEALRAINDKMGTSGLTSDDAIEIHQTMREICQRLNREFPAILQKLDAVHESQGQDSSTASTTLKNLGSSLPNSVTLPQVADPSELHEKVETLLTLCRSNPNVEGQGTGPPQTLLDNLTPELAKIRTLLEENKGQGILQGQQQVESVRYLNELNTWLEAFVNNGTSQINNLAMKIEQLSQYLGCGSQQPRGPANGGSGVLTAINQSLLNIQARDQGLAMLQTSVEGLLIAMKESHKSSNFESIANLIDRQRQDQEGLLRALTNEISDEIKGERLRFVEAMKEATAINVQIHVEQFKKELSREVSGMTEQVGRLHRERQAMEAQIADLFAFYTKQKEAVGLPPTERGAREHWADSSQRRPLPEPRRL